jgi:hypothetical protein
MTELLERSKKLGIFAEWSDAKRGMPTRFICRADLSSSSGCEVPPTPLAGTGMEDEHPRNDRNGRK